MCNSTELVSSPWCFSIVQCPYSKLLLRASLEIFGNTNQKIVIPVSSSLKALTQINNLQETLIEILTREFSDIDQPWLTIALLHGIEGEI